MSAQQIQIKHKPSHIKSDVSRLTQVDVSGFSLKTSNPLLFTLKKIRKLRLHIISRDDRSHYLPGYYTIGTRTDIEIVSVRTVIQSIFRFNKWIQLIKQHNWTLCFTAKDAMLSFSLSEMFKKTGIIGSLNNTWIPGSISNKAQTQRSKFRLEDTLPVKRNIDFLFVLNHNNVICQEAGMYNIPVIGFITTKRQMSSFFIPLFGRTNSISVIKFYLTSLYSVDKSNKLYINSSCLLQNI